MNPPASEPRTSILRIAATAVVDPLQGEVGCCLLAERVENLSLPAAAAGLGRSWRILAVGTVAEVKAHPAAAKAAELDLRECVVIPALVNAHTHLDLTHIGPQPHDPRAGFVPWVEMVRRNRLVAEEDIRRSVQLGIDLLLKGGVLAVGDISGSSNSRYSLVPWRTLRESALAGVSYVECFGIGQNEGSSRESLRRFVEEHGDEFKASQSQAMRLGLQPHAPNTVALPHYRWVLELAERFSALLSTHLAETPEEREFIAGGAGPQRSLLERVGLWDDCILDFVGQGRHPVAHLEPILAAAGPQLLAAHINDASDEAIEILARAATSVAYCPRASEYFGADLHFGPHRYRDMLSAGVNVALGTDSVINLPPDEVQRSGMSIFDEMRLLHRRDGADPLLLLQMGTVNGARALGLDPALWRIAPGERSAGLVAVPLAKREQNPLAAALRGSPALRLL